MEEESKNLLPTVDVPDFVDEEEDEEAEEILEQCDDLFYEHQDEINRILEKYAAGIKL